MRRNLIIFVLWCLAFTVGVSVRLEDYWCWPESPPPLTAAGKDRCDDYCVAMGAEDGTAYAARNVSAALLVCADTYYVHCGCYVPWDQGATP